MLRVSRPALVKGSIADDVDYHLPMASSGIETASMPDEGGANARPAHTSSSPVDSSVSSGTARAVTIGEGPQSVGLAAMLSTSAAHGAANPLGQPIYQPGRSNSTFARDTARVRLLARHVSMLDTRSTVAVVIASLGFLLVVAFIVGSLLVAPFLTTVLLLFGLLFLGLALYVRWAGPR